MAERPTYNSKNNNRIKKRLSQLLSQNTNYAYDASSDNVYRDYRTGSLDRSQIAAQRTVNKAKGINNGDTYSERVASGSRHVFDAKLNGLVPQLEAVDYQKNQSARQNQFDKLSALLSKENTEYSRYRDDVSDWEKNRKLDLEMAYAEKTKAEKEAAAQAKADAKAAKEAEKAAKAAKGRKGRSGGSSASTSSDSTVPSSVRPTEWNSAEYLYGKDPAMQHSSVQDSHLAQIGGQYQQTMANRGKGYVTARGLFSEDANPYLFESAGKNQSRVERAIDVAKEDDYISAQEMQDIYNTQKADIARPFVKAKEQAEDEYRDAIKDDIKPKSAEDFATKKYLADTSEGLKAPFADRRQQAISESGMSSFERNFERKYNMRVGEDNIEKVITNVDAKIAETQEKLDKANGALGTTDYTMKGGSEALQKAKKEADQYEQEMMTLQREKSELKQGKYDILYNGYSADELDEVQAEIKASGTAEDLEEFKKYRFNRKLDEANQEIDNNPELKKALDDIGFYDAKTGMGISKESPNFYAYENRARKEIQSLGYSRDEANAFIDAYVRNANAENAEYQVDKARDLAASGKVGATLASIKSMGENVGGAKDSAGYFMNYLRNKMSDDYRGYDYNNDYGQLRQVMNAERDQVSQDIAKGWAGQTGAFLYQTGMSIADSFLQRHMLGNASTVIMGMGAASDTARETAEKGLSENQVAGTALAAGVAEWFFEKVELDQLDAFKSGKIKNWKSFAENLAKQAATEGFGEGMTDITNFVADQVSNGYMSDFFDQVDAYMADGMSFEEAKAQAGRNQAKQVGLSVLGGALSGVVSGSGEQALKMFQIGGKMQNNTADIIEYGLDSAEGTEANIQANKALEKYGNDKKVGNIELAMLSQANAEVAAEEAVSQIDKTVKNADAAEGLKKAAVGENITTEEAEAIKNDANARTFVESTTGIELTSESGNELVKAAAMVMEGASVRDSNTQNVDERNKSAAEIMSNVDTSKISDAKAADITDAVRRISDRANISDEEYQKKMGFARQDVSSLKNMQSADRIKVLGAEAYYDGSPYTIKSISTKGSVQLVSEGGETIVAPTSEVSALDPNVENYLNTVDRYGKNGVHAFAQGYKNSGLSLEAYTNAFNAFYNSGKIGLPIDYVRNINGEMLSDDVKVMAYMSGVNDQVIIDNKAEKKATEARVARNPENQKRGQVKVNENTSKKFSKETINMIEDFAKQFNVNVEFFDSAMDSENGHYRAGTIYISNNSSNPAMVVAMHEYTHYMKQSAPTQYRVYRDEVINFLKSADSNFYEDLADSIRENYKAAGVKLTEDALMDEIVANATEAFVKNPETWKSSIIKNKGFKDKILEFLNNFGEFLKGESTKFDFSDSGAEALSLCQEELKRAADLWTRAANVASETGYVGDSKTSYSRASGNNITNLWAFEDDLFTPADIREINADVNALYRNHDVFIRNNNGEYVLPVNNKIVYIGGRFGSISINTVISVTADIDDTDQKNEAESLLSDYLRDEVLYYEKQGIDSRRMFSEIEEALRCIADSFFVWGANVSLDESGNYASRSTDGLHSKRRVYRSRNGFDFESEDLDGIDSKSRRRSKKNTPVIKRGTSSDGASFSLSSNSEGQKLTKQQAEFFKNSKVVDEDGRLKVVYHGTSRADRIGTLFDPKRATSGPMAYFTDNKKIGENYARDKKDTSISRDERYDSNYTMFRLDINGEDNSIEEAWNKLPAAKRNEIAKKAGHVTFDYDNDETAIIYDKNTDTGLGNMDSYLLREHNGNYLGALVESWLEDGNLYGEEGRFLEVLKLVGIDNAQYMDPNYREEKVYEVYLNITNPFDAVAQANDEFVRDIEKWWSGVDQSKYVLDMYSADMWDKSNMSMDRWLDRVRDDIKNGTTHAWTVVPDAVTDYLKEKGYDGIVDQGGKDGGEGHTVYIPFESNQVKDVNNLKPTAENDDIMYSIKPGLAMDVNADPEQDAMDALAQETLDILEGYKITESQIQALYNKMVAKNNSSYDEDAFKDKLANIALYLNSNYKKNAKMIMSTLQQMSKDIMDTSKEAANPENAEEVKKTKAELRGTQVVLTSTQLKDAIHAYGSLQNLRKETARRIKIASVEEMQKRGESFSTLDQQWSDLCDILPGLDRDASEGDMVGDLVEALNALYDPDLVSIRKKYGQGEVDYLAKQMANDMFLNLMSAVTPTNKKDAWNKLRSVYADKLAAHKEMLDKSYSEKLAKLKERYEGRNDRTLEAMARQRESVREQAAKRQENAKRSKYKKDARKIYDNLHKMLVNPTDAAYIPVDLVNAVCDVCQEINFDTGFRLADGGETQAFMKLDQMRRDYESMRMGESDYLKPEAGGAMYDARIPIIIDQMKEAFKDGRRVNDLTTGELEELVEGLSYIHQSVKKSTELIGKDNNKKTYTAAASIIEDVNRAAGLWKGRLNWDNPVGNFANTSVDKAGLVANKAVSQFLSPERFARRLVGYKDNSMMLELFDDLTRGEAKMHEIQMDIDKIMAPVMEGRENAKQLKRLTGSKAEWFDYGFTDDAGNPVRITPAMRIALYLHMQNNGNLEHIENGGMLIPNERLYKAGKMTEAYAQGTVVKHISRQTLQNIVKDMTDYEKQFAKVASQVFNDYSKRKINETSLALSGYEKARVTNYFPISTDKDFLNKQFDSLAYDASITSAGQLKGRVRHAKNPIMLEEVTSALQRQQDFVSRYAGLAIPISNFGKVMNVSLVDKLQNDDGSMTVEYKDSMKKAIKSKWGTEAMSYIENMVTDLNGARKSSDKTIVNDVLNKTRGNLAAGVLTGNVSVMIKQTASYPVAIATLGYKPVAQALLLDQRGHTKKSRQELIDLIDKYTGEYHYRAKGNSTQELGDLNNQNSVNTALMRVPGVRAWLNGIQKFDLATTRLIWKAAEIYVKDNNPDVKVGSDSYYRLVADMYNKTIHDTQPNYATMQRPELLRTNSEVTKVLTMFMTQRLQNGNLMYDSAANMIAKQRMYKSDKSGENKIALAKAQKEFAATMTSQIISAAVIASMNVVKAVLLYKINRYRDEEGNLTPEAFWTKFIEDAGSSLAGSFLGGSTLYDYILSAVTGEKYYGISDNLLGSINDFASASQDVITTYKQHASGNMTDEKFNEKMSKYMMEMGTYLGQMLGIPFANAKDMIQGTYLHVQDAMNGEFGSFEAGYQRKNKQLYDLYFDALNAGDSVASQKWYNQLINAGQSEEQISSAMKNRLKDTDVIAQAAAAVESGDVAAYEKYVEDATGLGFDQNDVISAVKSSGSDKEKKNSDPKPERMYNDEMLGTAVTDLNLSKIDEMKDDYIASSTAEDPEAEFQKKVNRAAKDEYSDDYINAVLSGDTSEIERLEKSFDDLGIDSEKYHGWIGKEAKEQLAEKYGDAYASGNVSKIEKYEEMFDDLGISESTYSKWGKSDMKKAFAEAYESGDKTKMDQLIRAAEKVGIEEGELWATASKEQVKEVTSSVDAAIKSFSGGGKSFDAAKDEAIKARDELLQIKMSQGKSEKDAKSSIKSGLTSYYKPLYKDMSQEDRNRLQNMLLSYFWYDKSTGGKPYDFNKWLEE